MRLAAIFLGSWLGAYMGGSTVEHRRRIWQGMITQVRVTTWLVWKWGLCMWPRGKTHSLVTHHVAGLDMKSRCRLCWCQHWAGGSAMDQAWSPAFTRAPSVILMPMIVVVEVQVLMQMLFSPINLRSLVGSVHLGVSCSNNIACLNAAMHNATTHIAELGVCA